MTSEAKVYSKVSKAVFRKMGLGTINGGGVRVIAGMIPAQWWSPYPSPEPVFVTARIIAQRAASPESEGRK